MDEARIKERLASSTARPRVLGECVYARCPHHRSTTTNTAQPQRVGALFPMPSCLGTPVGPGKDTHGTLGPEQRGGRGWPTPTPKGRSAHAMTRTQDSPTHKSSDKHGGGAGDHQLQVTITNRRRRLSRYRRTSSSIRYR